MNLFADDMRKLLVSYVALGSAWDTACLWLQENSERWETWLPNETACASGRGLVNVPLRREIHQLKGLFMARNV